jgi:hypothetical protein
VSVVAEAVGLAIAEFGIVADKDPSAKETIEAMKIIWSEGIVTLRG